MYETLTPKELCEMFETDENNGLKDAEASHRLQRAGENVLRKTKDRTIWDMIQEQINDPMIFILFLAASISLLLREFSDTGIILAVIVLNTAIGVMQEGRAKNALETLKTMTAPTAIVKRDGVYKNIPASQIVKGDLVKIKAGNQVPADLRLIRAQGISVNESALTGESLPVNKTSEALRKGLPMAEKKNMLYMSTEVMKGSGEGIVTATGMNTEIGKIADMLHETAGELTPLQNVWVI